VDNSGKVTQLSISMAQLREESRLHMRELLLLEQPSALIQPHILPRRHCILLTVGYVRALVWTDRVYLFGFELFPQVREYVASLAAQVQQIFAPAAAANAAATTAPSGNTAGSGSNTRDTMEDEEAAWHRAVSDLFGSNTSSASASSSSAPASTATPSQPGSASAPETTETTPRPAACVDETHFGAGSASSPSNGSNSNGGHIVAGAPPSGVPTQEESTPFEMVIVEHALLTLQARAY
jgi:hypothetical protein